MKTHAKVVVIGGGVVGASVLYHLTKAGWSDVMLIERAELTAGSTWHAAGGMHTVNGDPNVAKLQQYTIELYKEIEAISGQSCGVHLTGGIMLAGTPERLDWLKMAQARGRYLGMDLDIISVSEAKKIFPFMDEKHFVGALFDPVEGHVDPYGVTHAYAKAAQIQGATIERQCRVTDLQPRPDGTWDVITENGNVHAEHVVNAGGLWAREVGRMVGLELPVLAMEHQYLITEDMPELAGRTEQFHCIDFEGEIYMRQERGGMLMGTYERKGVPWSERETPWDFGQNLLPDDLDRIAPSLEVGFEHFPAIATAGIKKVVNGPFTFAPDGNPLIGPVKGLKNFWVACGVMAGFSQGGGVGLALSNWMVDGDPGFDVWGMDVSRYGDWTTMAYTNAKVRENYSRRFSIRFPNEELPAARPLRTTPVYDILKAENACFGDYVGLEYPLWFAPKGVEPVEDVTFRRSSAHDYIGAECKAVREARGADRDLELRQVRGHRPQCGVVPVRPDGQSPARHRPHGADPDAEPCRQADRRFHHRAPGAGPLLRRRHARGRDLLHALVRSPYARRGRRDGTAVRGRICRVLGCRPAEPGRAAESRRARPCHRGLPVHEFRRNVGRHGTGARRPGLFHGRSRLRDLVQGRLSARPLCGADRRRQRSWAEARRRPGAELAAAREEFRHLGPRIPADLRAGGGRPRPLRRPQEERFHRARRRGEGPQQWRLAAAARHLRGRGRRRRCDRRRTGVA